MSDCTKENYTKDDAQRSRKRKADVAILLEDPDENLEMQLLEMSRKRQFEQQGGNSYNLWQSRYQFLPTSQKPSYAPPYPQYASLRYRWSSFSPLPRLSWANPDDVWKNMLQKDEMYVRDKNYLQRHPALDETMRPTLLEWLMEISEVHKLHRDTFYIAQDFLDRFMATQENVMKSKLQLIGITCLFIAAKIEEVYPPKLHDLAYFTDGACTEDEMLSMELIIMKALNWSLSPITVVSWLNIYLQVAYSKELQHFLIPQYPQKSFLQIMELLDLCTLDMECMDYSYRVLAAAALYHCTNPEYIQEVTGYQWTDITSCIQFLLPFAMAISNSGRPPKLGYFAGVAMADMHVIQTHRDHLDTLKKAQHLKEMYKNMRENEDNTAFLLPPVTMQPLTS
ncbi:G1/S-specific cyclin-E3-like [Anomaloglossus baeobatrachus]|uniref:G1/S-specific cyclin-E3-like n=1 Tax=Anomaloglossus baeobatrachus TaxID=238106 RepID=UPI003F4FE13C